MSEHWGATAEWTMVGPYQEEVLRYTDGPRGLSGVTLPDGDEANHDTIAAIRDRINNQHPEDIAVLADQWVNMANLLGRVREQLLTMGWRLAEQAWRSPQARQEFLRAGPGTTLAYLDEWIDAAWRNVTILRAAVGIARQARSEIERLWQNYERDVHAARYRDVDPFVQFSHFEMPWQFWDGDKWREEWNEARDELRSAAVRDVQNRYDSDARKLAYRVAQSYIDTYIHTQSGFGPYYRPMNTVMNEMNGVPPLPALPPLPVIGAPPAVPGGLPDTEPPGVPAPGGIPAPDGPGVPAGPPSPGGASPLGVPGLPGVPAVIGAPSSAPPGSVPNPAGRPSGLPANSGMPGAPGSMRSMLPPAAPRGGVLRSPGRRDDQRVHGPAPTEESFSMPPGRTAPPVLNNPRNVTRRGGSREGAPVVPGVGQEQFPTAPVGASPPVVGGPARTAPPAVTPRRDKDRAAATPPPAGGGADWLELDGLRAAAAPPVVDAPTLVDGRSVEPAAAPGLSRGAGAARPGAGGQPSPAEPEVEAARRIARAAAAPPEPAPLTDEAAFTVEGPGGGVVAKQRPGAEQRNEPPATLSGPSAAGG